MKSALIYECYLSKATNDISGGGANPATSQFVPTGATGSTQQQQQGQQPVGGDPASYQSWLQFLAYQRQFQAS